LRLVVGLGNPGKRYARTRHNTGFRVLDGLAEKMGETFSRRKFKGEYAEGRLPDECSGPVAGDGKVLLVKPQTYMNLSGETVVCFKGYYKIALDDILVVVDDVNLATGKLRLRRSGSAGGHNGLKDIESRLGSRAYARLRIGVGGRESDSGDRVEALTGHVLGRFSAEEEQILDEALARAVRACLTWAGRGVDEAMNVFNAASGEKQAGRNAEES
jgi:PTH1 family peptidyl-tRNA hydrolase